MRDTFLVPFEACSKANAMAMMCSYNGGARAPHLRPCRCPACLRNATRMHAARQRPPDLESPVATFGLLEQKHARRGTHAPFEHHCGHPLPPFSRLCPPCSLTLPS